MLLLLRRDRGSPAFLPALGAGPHYDRDQPRRRADGRGSQQPTPLRLTLFFDEDPPCALVMRGQEESVVQASAKCRFGFDRLEHSFDARGDIQQRFQFPGFPWKKREKRFFVDLFSAI